MANVDLITAVHTATQRDYVGRVTSVDKAAVAEVAIQYGEAYWDGDRTQGYGGYRYDGRWRPVAERMVQLYGLKAGSRVLDVGCGKGFLLYELTQVVPGLIVTGLDISAYAIANAKPEVRVTLEVGDAKVLPYATGSFDFVYSINTLHNLHFYVDMMKQMRAAIAGGGFTAWASAFLERRRSGLEA